MELKKRLGQRIKELRCQHNLKQSELAEIVGIATKSQSCIETGKNYPSAELVEKYAKAFRIDIAELLDIGYLKDVNILIKEIEACVNSATPEKIRTIYKIVKGICG